VPELPEVEQTVRELRPVLEGATINRVVVRRRRLRRLLPRDFEARLEGTTVRALGRRGKYLVAALSSGETLVMHLGMSGSFEVWTSNAPPPGKHDHVLFQLGSGATVVFNDPRRFGSMQIHSGHGDPLLGLLGPEPLDSAFDARALATSLCRRRTTLKAALCDQRVVAGLGNIYVSEALHRAGLSPNRGARSLAMRSGKPTERAERLVPAIRAVLKEAIAAGGSTLRDHRRTDGELGYFQHSFQVYGREGEPCRRKGCTGIIRRIIQGGRATFYCSVCQR
jgi:formamidopyrimidine-DNA glycosylase